MMSKTEFLDILYNQLSGQMPEGSVAAHVQYYRNYIEDEQQKGRTETDILNDLGDPRLIARTLLDTEVGAGNPQNGSTYSAIYNEADSDYNEYDSSDSARGHVKKHSFKLDLSTWYGKVAVILIAAVVLLLLVTILGILIPVVIVAGVIMYIVSQFRKQ
jgi:predicted membrane protein